MTTDAKDYYASKGVRKGWLIFAILNFCAALYYLFRGMIDFEGFYYALGIFGIYCIVGLVGLYHYLRTHHLPVAQAGPGWIVIRQGWRNRRPFTARSRVKGIRIVNTDLHCIRNNLFSLMICTVDGYRYFISGLANRDRQELLQRLQSG